MKVFVNGCTMIVCSFFGERLQLLKRCKILRVKHKVQGFYRGDTN